DQEERDDYETAGVLGVGAADAGVAVDVGGYLGHVQGAAAAVDERDPGQRQVGADAVGDGEVERALDRAALFRAVRGQRVGGNAHQLEPHEQVEHVPGEAEPGHAREERQHQDVEVGGDAGEVPP